MCVCVCVCIQTDSNTKDLSQSQYNCVCVCVWERVSVFWFICYILTLDRTVNQEITCVNKRKNRGSRCTLNNNLTRAQTAWISRRQDAELRASGRQRVLSHQWPMVEQRSQDEKEVLLGQYSSLSPSPAHLSHTTNINPFANKVWEIYFYQEVW